MTIIESILSNDEVNWIALNTISDIALTAALVLITWWYAHQIERRARMDRLHEEMDLLISPLYSKSKSELKNIFYMKGFPGNIDSNQNRVRDYFQFWDNVNRYKYLGPDFLRSALDEYLKNKVNSVSNPPRDLDYEKAEKDLFEKIDQRYNELQKML
jgi:hypothetical protein